MPALVGGRVRVDTPRSLALDRRCHGQCLPLCDFAIAAAFRRAPRARDLAAAGSRWVSRRASTRYAVKNLGVCPQRHEACSRLTLGEPSQVFFKRSTIYVPFVLVGAYFANEVGHGCGCCGVARKPGRNRRAGTTRSASGGARALRLAARQRRAQPKHGISSNAVIYTRARRRLTRSSTASGSRRTRGCASRGRPLRLRMRPGRAGHCRSRQQMEQVAGAERDTCAAVAGRIAWPPQRRRRRLLFIVSSAASPLSHHPRCFTPSEAVQGYGDPRARRVGAIWRQPDLRSPDLAAPGRERAP